MATLGGKPGLILHSQAPYNAEPSLARLRAAGITAQAEFYVRCHGDIPALNLAQHRLRVRGRMTQPMELSVPELRRTFPERRVAAVMQCAGNRRADLQAVHATTGDPWSAGAIGHAVWTGVALVDVLQAAGADPDRSLHVAFEACDVVEMPKEGRFTYGVSIPMAKAMSSEVLLATEINGEALSPEHGFPLRVVVPGYAGVRSVKWLSDIIVKADPSDNHMQQRDYKLLPPGVTEETVDWSNGIVINDMPLTSAICEPASGAVVPSGRVVVRGYALATARPIVRVDISADGGCNWRQATLEPMPDSPWSWTFWTMALELPKGAHELVVRAWDSAGQTQPALAADTWNFKGYLNASWHRVHLSAV